MLFKGVVIQIVIQIVPTSVKEHGIVVYVIKEWMLIVNLDKSILIFTNAENDLLFL